MIAEKAESYRAAQGASETEEPCTIVRVLGGHGETLSRELDQGDTHTSVLHAQMGRTPAID